MWLDYCVLLLAIAAIPIINGFRLPTDGLTLFSVNLNLNFTQESFTTSPYEYTGYLQINYRLSQREYSTDIQMFADHNYITINRIFLDDTELTDYSINSTNDVLTIIGSRNISDFTYSSKLYIYFKSRISTSDLFGLYRVNYKTAGGESKYFIASQFEPTYTKRVFPFFDDPLFKTRISFYITHPPEVEVLSNYPGNITDTSDIIYDDPSLNTTQFTIPYKLASYMTSLILTQSGEFTCTEGENITEYGGMFSVCSTPDTEGQRTWALENGLELMRNLINFTNYIYFSKMDQVALPHLFTEATENWAFVTYREQNLLLDEDNSSIMDKQNIATMITFESAQMWFGNIVTPLWWSQSYITKGLAYYLKYFITQRVFTDWELYKQFIFRVFYPAMEMDTLFFTQPLQAEASDLDEIYSKLDQMTHLKGGSLFYMLKEVIAGYDNFQKGLEYFLTSFEERNSEPQGMWNLISAQVRYNKELLPTNKVLKDVLFEWENYPGYPLLEITRDNYKTVTVSQKGRLTYIGVNESYQWYVPVSYTFSSNLTDFDNATLNQWLLPNQKMDIWLPSVDEKWVILNTKATGYYRVNYGLMWQNITEALQEPDFSGIPDSSRTHLLDDAFALARTNILNYTFVLDFAKFLSTDDSLYPWMIALNAFNYILRRVGPFTNLGMAVTDRLFEMFGKIYDSVPWSEQNEENHPYTMKQIEVLTAACSLGYSGCVKSASAKFEEFKATGERPDKNFRSLIYCTGLKYSMDSADWDLLWNLYLNTDLESEKIKILSALGCTENEELLKTYINLSLDESLQIKPQDGSIVFNSVFRNNNQGVSLALKFLIENHQKIVTRYQDMNCLRNMVLGLAEYITNTDDVTSLRTFLNSPDTENVFKSVKDQSLEIAENNIMWRTDHLDELYKYFGVNPKQTSSLLD